ncbi:MAG: hypothetical protein HQ559_02520 [Lentisphaerae bacterium]|nr:hypothetical protein [Lentisphaerota bacterium]
MLKMTIVRHLVIATVFAASVVCAQSKDKAGLGKPVEVDTETGAKIYVLGDDERPADHIYGEQPYGDVTGRRIAIRYHSLDDKPGGLNILDLQDGSNHEILSGDPPFPAFHAWGEWLYYAQAVEGKNMLRRCNYLSLKVENVAELPPERGIYSYGAISPDHRYYAVSVREPEGGKCHVHLLDLKTNQWSILLNKPGYLAQHEQFSRDGRNRVLIQLNQMPDVETVLLHELEVDGTERAFPASLPYTLRPTGHETWIGTSSEIFFSTSLDPKLSGNLDAWRGRSSEIPFSLDQKLTGNLWRAKVGDKKATLIDTGRRFLNHLSVSRDGRYWIADGTKEEDIPLYIGSFKSDRFKRICFSRTKNDGKQWSHTHPYLTADNQWVIFGACRNGGRARVYGIKLEDGWLQSL